MKNKIPCPICGEGDATRDSEMNAGLKMYFYHCDHCGSDFGDAAVTKENKRIFNEGIDGNDTL